MSSLRPSEIYLTQDALEYPVTKKILSAFPGAGLFYLKHPRELYFKPDKDPLEVSRAKKRLFLTVRKSSFLEKCPGTKEHLCCNYFVLKNVVGCDMDCSYCYLQGYQNLSAIQIYVNLGRITEDVEIFLRSFPEKMTFRLGTGEFSDSLSLDSLVEINAGLISLFARRKNAYLELKTKSCRIEPLLSLSHGGRTVLGWSLNPQKIISSEEKRTASLAERLKAARKACEAGYPVSFHFDPIFHYPSWERDYADTIEALFSHVPAGKIAWMSLGTFRFYPWLKPILKKRFPGSTLIYSEFLRGSDGKFRYIIDLRRKMILSLKKIIEKNAPRVPLYLCMENERIWLETFGALPEKINGLDFIFR